MGKSLYEMEPSDDATADEWKKWAGQLKRRTMDCEERYEKSKQQTNSYRKQIQNQQSAFAYYKTTLADRDNTIETIKKNKAYILAKFVGSLWGRIKACIRGKNA